jgi:hypothetical protein
MAARPLRRPGWPHTPTPTPTHPNIHSLSLSLCALCGRWHPPTGAVHAHVAAGWRGGAARWKHGCGRKSSTFAMSPSCWRWASRSPVHGCHHHPTIASHTVGPAPPSFPPSPQLYYPAILEQGVFPKEHLNALMCPALLHGILSKHLFLAEVPTSWNHSTPAFPTPIAHLGWGRCSVPRPAAGNQRVRSGRSGHSHGRPRRAGMPPLLFWRARSGLLPSSSQRLWHRVFVSSTAAWPTILTIACGSFKRHGKRRGKRHPHRARCPCCF